MPVQELESAKQSASRAQEKATSYAQQPQKQQQQQARQISEVISEVRSDLMTARDKLTSAVTRLDSVTQFAQQYSPNGQHAFEAIEELSQSVKQIANWAEQSGQQSR